MRHIRRLVISLVAVGIALLVGGGLWLSHQGYHAYIVHTGSMTGTYNSGDLVIDKPVTGPLRIGEPITFYHSGLSSDVVTHRIVGLKRGTIQTKGDANRTRDTWDIRHNQVKGTVMTSLPTMGYAIYFLKQPAGVAAVMTAALAIIFLWGMFFPTELSELVPPAAGAAAGRALNGVNQLRGHGRHRRADSDAVEILRSRQLATTR
jgi:signal peptidase